MKVLKNRPYILCFDFDETIIINGFPDISTAVLKKDCKEVINRLYDEGFYIIIWTCRHLKNHIDDMINFLNKNEIKFHKINENCSYLQFKPYPKIYYDYILDDKSLLCDVEWDSIYNYIIQKLIKDWYITDEMYKYFIKRTNNHINLVKKYCKRIYEITNNKKILNRSEIHDKSKFQFPEMLPYVLITWNYYCKNNNIEFILPENIKSIMNIITEHHILNNSHHPEFYSEKIGNLINKEDRDSNKIENIINAFNMKDIDILEMCADWCAVSEERNNTPFEWAEKVINKRWEFTNYQIKLIYETLENIW